VDGNNEWKYAMMGNTISIREGLSQPTIMLGLSGGMILNVIGAYSNLQVEDYLPESQPMVQRWYDSSHLRYI
jgi:hypothetical protein